MTTEKLSCLINEADCGLVAGNPVCPKCGMDERVVYPGQEDLEVAIKSAILRFNDNSPQVTLEIVEELVRSGEVQPAIDMLEHLANTNDSHAMFRLYEIYRWGCAGQEQDLVKSDLWLNLAATAKMPKAQYQLAIEEGHKGSFEIIPSLLKQAIGGKYEYAYTRMAQFILGIYPFERFVDNLHAREQQAIEYTAELKNLDYKSDNESFWARIEAIRLIGFHNIDLLEKFGFGEIEEWLNELQNQCDLHLKSDVIAVRMGVDYLKAISSGPAIEAVTPKNSFKEDANLGRLSISLLDLIKNLRAQKNVNLPLIFYLLTQSSKLKNAEASILMAKALLNGEGVQVDISEGLLILRKVADEGNPDAALELARIHSKKDVQTFDLKTAKQWYDIAKVSDNHLTEVGRVYLFGEAELRNPTEGVALLKRAVRVGGWLNRDASRMLGVAYGLGIGVEASVEISDEWFDIYINTRDQRQPANAVMFEISKLFKEAPNINRDLQTRWAFRAAEAGCKEAACGVAWNLQFKSVLPLLSYQEIGWQVGNLGLQESPELALKYWLIAAEGGDLQASVACAFYFASTQHPTHDPQAAVNWMLKLAKAVEKGDSSQRVAEASLQMAALASQGILPAVSGLSVEFWKERAIKACKANDSRLNPYLFSGDKIDLSSTEKIAVLGVLAENDDRNAMRILGVELIKNPSLDGVIANKWFNRYIDKWPGSDVCRYMAAEEIVSALAELPNWRQYLTPHILEWLKKAHQLGSWKAPYTLAFLRCLSFIDEQAGSASDLIKSAYLNALNDDKKYNEKNAVDVCKLYGFCGLLVLPTNDLPRSCRIQLNVALAELGSGFNGVELFRIFGTDNDEEKSDPKEAFYWLNQAANGGFVDAIYERSQCYINGYGVEKDIRKFLADTLLAANLGHIDAMLQLARIYIRNDSEFQQDIVAAMSWIGRAEAAAGEFRKIIDVFYGRLDDPNIAKMYFACCKRWADKGEINALERLAACYCSGIGANPDQDECNRLIDKWLELAWPEKKKRVEIEMARGDVGVEAHESDLPHFWFAFGLFGFKKDEKQAFNWCRRLIGLKERSFLLERMGDAYCFGYGVDPDIDIAVKWWRRSFEVNHRSLGLLKSKVHLLRIGKINDINDLKVEINKQSGIPYSDQWRALLRMMLEVRKNSNASIEDVESLLTKCRSLSLAHEVFVDFLLSKPHSRQVLSLALNHIGRAHSIAKSDCEHGVFVGNLHLEKLRERQVQISRLKPLSLAKLVLTREFWK